MALDPITSLLEIGKSAIERIWPDANKRAEELRKLEELKQRGDLARLDAEVKLLVAQLEVNKVEASHSSIFIAGPRPFVMWVCAISLLYAALIEPIMRFIATMYGYTGEYPVINTDITMQILMGMLGLGVMRSYDKMKNVDTKKISKV